MRKIIEKIKKFFALAPVDKIIVNRYYDNQDIPYAALSWTFGLAIGLTIGICEEH